MCMIPSVTKTDKCNFIEWNHSWCRKLRRKHNEDINYKPADSIKCLFSHSYRKKIVSRINGRERAQMELSRSRWEATNGERRGHIEETRQDQINHNIKWHIQQHELCSISHAYAATSHKWNTHVNLEIIWTYTTPFHTCKTCKTVQII